MDGPDRKIIWVIGAGSGIGKSLAIELAKQGHQLILSGRRVDRLESVKTEFIHDAQIIPLDVTIHDDVMTAYSEIKRIFQRLDSVIFMSANYQPMPLDNLDYSVCKNIIDTNLVAAFSVLQTVIPDMKSLGSGQIVLCGSVAGFRGLPNGQPYSATKAAIINLAETARTELQGYGIDVKVINPGFVKTEMTDKNAFEMPMLITTDLAAKRIIKQLFKPNIFEIKTHLFFMFLMKFIKIIPDSVYFKIFSSKSR